MTPLELRDALSNPDEIRRNPFHLVKEISCLLLQSDDQRTPQELLLRALERRSEFGPAAQILNGLLRGVGLFPYLENEALGVADRLACEAHRPPALDDVVFHHPQARVFHTLMQGKSVVLSAPTSFGKSLVIDAVVASHRFHNIVVVVPTLALIDETRRRLARFRDHYSIVTQSFQTPGERNVFVMTQERVLDSKQIDEVDFFVIDEFYKLSPLSSADERAALLNQVFYQLSKKCRHFYLLGPGIQGISDDFQSSLSFEYLHEPYQTVVSELHRVRPGQKPLEKLRELASSLDGPTLVFCSSPERAHTVAESLPSSDPSSVIEQAADWIAEHYHPEWRLVSALRAGIGIHHGRIPRALAQFIVRAFNDEELPFLACTSTLIEGVNTKAKNIIIYDHKINRQAIDLFTFNNIRGRSGRMFKHFVGHVYLFHDPPQEGLPFVDVPAFTQSANASDALLVQLDSEDLTDESETRLTQYHSHPELPFSVIKANVGIDPEAQVAVAEELASDANAYARRLAWSGIPSYNDLLPVCELIWSFFGGSSLGSGSARNPRQLAAMLMQLSRQLSIREFVETQMQFAASADRAVRAVLDFQRLWASFHFPRLLRAIGRIQTAVFAKRNLPSGNFGQYASLVEHLFLPPAAVALEEYGIPLPLARKLLHYISLADDTERILAHFKQLPIRSLELLPFERDLVEDARSTM